jgi:hypothetical protein
MTQTQVRTVVSNWKVQTAVAKRQQKRRKKPESESIAQCVRAGRAAGSGARADNLKPLFELRACDAIPERQLFALGVS